MFNCLKKPKTLLALGTAVFMTLATATGLNLTKEDEGVRLNAYYDSVGVKTVCVGETKKIIPGKTYTMEECMELYKVQYQSYSSRTVSLYNDTAKSIVTPEIHAAMTDMSYNIGVYGVSKSSMIRHLNSGEPKKACDAILKYKYAGGRNCTIRKNNCYGVWKRRLKWHKVCLQGVK